MNKILSPFKIRALRDLEYSSELIYEPLSRGFGYTLGNSLRRVLLSSIKGSRITAIEGESISHELATLPGVSEDIAEICLNLHSVRIYVPGDEVYTLSLSVNEEKYVYASDIEVNSGVEILNPEVMLFKTDGSVPINIKIICESNIGICQKEELTSYNRDLIGRIYLHEKYFFSPILNVALNVEEYTIGRNRNVYDRLKLTVKTDGSIKPIDAVSTAAHSLQEILNTFIQGDVIYENDIEEKEEYQIDEKLFTKIIDMNLSTRAENSLVNAGIKYLGDLLSKDPNKLQSKITNFGQKSFDEVFAKLESMGYEWNGKIEWPSSSDKIEEMYKEYINRR